MKTLKKLINPGSLNVKKVFRKGYCLLQIPLAIKKLKIRFGGNVKITPTTKRNCYVRHLQKKFDFFVQ